MTAKNGLIDSTDFADLCAANRGRMQLRRPSQKWTFVSWITDPITQANTEAPEIDNGERGFERPVTQESDRMTVIRPGGSSLSLYLKEIWTYRELLYFLALREVKVRYKQTVFGIAWA